jgi:hypothetical protein
VSFVTGCDCLIVSLQPNKQPHIEPFDYLYVFRDYHSMPLLLSISPVENLVFDSRINKKPTSWAGLIDI